VIQEFLKMEMGSSSQLSKWALDRLGDGCYTSFLEFCNGGFKERANIGSHQTRVQVQSPALKETAARTIPCAFC